MVLVHNFTCSSTLPWNHYSFNSLWIEFLSLLWWNDIIFFFFTILHWHNPFFHLELPKRSKRALVGSSLEGGDSYAFGLLSCCLVPLKLILSWLILFVMLRFSYSSNGPDVEGMAQSSHYINILSSILCMALISSNIFIRYHSLQEWRLSGWHLLLMFLYAFFIVIFFSKLYQWLRTCSVSQHLAINI